MKKFTFSIAYSTFKNPMYVIRCYECRNILGHAFEDDGDRSEAATTVTASNHECSQPELSLPDDNS